MNDQVTKSENKFLGSILIFSITIVTWMIFIPGLNTFPTEIQYNINDKSEQYMILAEVKTNEAD